MRALRAVAVVVVLAAGTTAAIGSTGGELGDYEGTARPVAGVRPTAVGLPQIGATGSFGASELTDKLAEYHDSGRYAQDLRTVDAAARDFLDARLAADRAPATRTCTSRYTRVKRKRGLAALYKRRRACATIAPPRLDGKPALVLDIDETSLSNYSSLAATGFSVAGLAFSSIAARGQAIEPTLDLFRHARSKGVAVFFVTGRTSIISSITQANLRAAGYDGWQRVDYKPSSMGTAQFKSAARARIESEGYAIVANVGDQESDLDGGHALKGFKLPNPFYFASD